MLSSFSVDSQLSEYTEETLVIRGSDSGADSPSSSFLQNPAQMGGLGAARQSFAFLPPVNT